MENLNEGKKKKASYMAELAEIDKQSAIVAMEAKINKLAEMVETKNARLSMVSEDENLSELIDKKQVKMMEREIKEIERAKLKLEKLYEKMSGGKKKEVVDEEEKMDEVNDPGENTGVADLDGLLGNYMNEEDDIDEGIEDELRKNKGVTYDEAEPAQVTKEKGLAEFNLREYLSKNRLLNETVDLKSLMNGDKVNNDALVVMATSYKDEDDARKKAMRPKSIKDNSENAGPGAKLMVFANLAGGPDREMKIEDGKVVDIRLLSDWDK